MYLNDVATIQRNLLRAPEDTDTLISNAHGLSDPAAPRWGLAINLSLDNTIGYLYAADGRVFDAPYEDFTSLAVDAAVVVTNDTGNAFQPEAASAGAV